MIWPVICVAVAQEKGEPMGKIEFDGRPIHFIGIGGIGMSALAYVVTQRNLPISGSDAKPNHITARLAELGARIFDSQVAGNIEEILKTSSVGLPQIVCSTAISPTNPELAAATERGCPIFHRSDVLAALIAESKAIGVAGTHGKTTTSSAISCMLLGASVDITAVLGGEIVGWEAGNARLGTSEYLVAEVDESDGSLVKHHPYIGIITNIELDHTDRYHSIEEVIDTFKIFEKQCQITIGSWDCPIVKGSLNVQISYSLNPDSNADYIAKAIEYSAIGTKAEIWERGNLLGTLNLKVLGQHNLSNALAAIASGRVLELPFDALAAGLATFEGARRRFELRGTSGGISFIDDYAHHPSEILVTLAAARLKVGSSGRVVAIFQPHRYSRTLTFLDEFAASFGDADVVILTDIYSAGEQNDGRIDGEKLCQAVSRHHASATYCPTPAAAVEKLHQILQPGDMAIFLGAGNLNQSIPSAMAHYPN
jgi:UDP-N-acetylmuramate--alanine ligase